VSKSGLKTPHNFDDFRGISNNLRQTQKPLQMKLFAITHINADGVRVQTYSHIHFETAAQAQTKLDSIIRYSKRETLCMVFGDKMPGSVEVRPIILENGQETIVEAITA
jgi:hypothetical protein